MKNFILIVVFALTGCGFLMAGMSTKPYQLELDVNLSDKFGNPLRNVEIELWEYDRYSKYATTDENGKVKFQKGILESGLSRPGAIDIPIRLRFDSRQNGIDAFLPFYYRFEVNGRAKDVPYNIFISSYDYWFGGTWAGTFYNKTSGKDPEFSKRIMEGFSFKTYKAVPLRAPGRYDDKNKYIAGDLLTTVDAFDVHNEVFSQGKDAIRVQLDIQHKGYWKYYPQEKQ